MSPITHLQIPTVEAFRRRTSSEPQGRDRYVITGGFVNIQDLSKGYETPKGKKSKQQHGLFGSVSPRSRSSRASSSTDDVESQEWDFLTTSPHRSESWSSPQTPRTPFAGIKQTSYTFDHCQKATIITPPPLSRYNQHGHDLYLELSPQLSHLSQNGCAFDTQRIVTPTRAQSTLGEPIELPGSLLLPSQGFPQSYPPKVPPHVNERSHSAPAVPGISQPSSMIPEAASTLIDYDKLEPVMALIPPMPTSNDSKAKRQVRTAPSSRSTSTSEWSNQDALPMRKSSLRSKPTMPQCGPPPVPLSKMSLEELIQVLPTLDAAIIAHDWVPCILARHRELKHLLKTLEGPPTVDAALQSFDKVRTRMP